MREKKRASVANVKEGVFVSLCNAESRASFLLLPPARGLLLHVSQTRKNISVESFAGILRAGENNARTFAWKVQRVRVAFWDEIEMIRPFARFFQLLYPLVFPSRYEVISNFRFNVLILMVPPLDSVSSWRDCLCLISKRKFYPVRSLRVSWSSWN